MDLVDNKLEFLEIIDWKVDKAFAWNSLTLIIFKIPTLFTNTSNV